jgi:hypothetical protein
MPLTHQVFAALTDSKGNLVDKRAVVVIPNDDGSWSALLQAPATPAADGKPYELIAGCQNSSFQFFAGGFYAPHSMTIGGSPQPNPPASPTQTRQQLSTAARTAGVATAAPASQSSGTFPNTGTNVGLLSAIAAEPILIGLILLVGTGWPSPRPSRSPYDVLPPDRLRHRFVKRFRSLF